MDIAKQKEIIALHEEAHALVNEYQIKRYAALEIHTPKLLDLAVSEFITYIKKQGFTVSGDRQGDLKADSGDGLIITLNRKPHILSVHMPNMEYYSIMVECTLEPPEKLNISTILSQDSQISEYLEIIKKTKRQIIEVDNTNYRYSLYKEPHDGNYGKNIKTFRRFSEILEIMFS